MLISGTHGYNITVRVAMRVRKKLLEDLDKILEGVVTQEGGLYSGHPREYAVMKNLKFLLNKEIPKWLEESIVREDNGS